MKKWLIGLIIFTVICSLLIFIFIPSNLKVSDVMVMKANRYAALRNLYDEAEWIKWWPTNNKVNLKGNQPYYNGYSYHVAKKFYNGIDIDIQNESKTYKGKIIVIPFSDSIAIQFETTLLAGINPIDRFLSYQKAVDMKKSFRIFLDSLKSFNENKQRVYRFNIHNTTLKDTSLVAIKITTKDSPSTRVIYDLISTLKKYIALQKAKETDYPILNITKLDNAEFATMVAIATDRSLPDNGEINFKRMIPYKDKILVAEVKGGPATIQQAYNEVEKYMNDYGLSAPVIPFEYLITDRTKETDTTKWITKIYTPIR